MRLPSLKNRVSLPSDLAGIAVCIVISLVVYFGFVGPFVEKRSVHNNQYQELAQQRAQVSKLGDLVAGLEKQLTSMQKELAHREIKLESADQVNERIAKLTALFSNCNLEVDDVRIGKIVNDLRCYVVPISVAGRGAYKQCAAFLHELSQTFSDTCAVRFDLEGNPARPEELCKFRYDLLWSALPNVQVTKR